VNRRKFYYVFLSKPLHSYKEVRKFKSLSLVPANEIKVIRINGNKYQVLRKIPVEVFGEDEKWENFVKKNHHPRVMTLLKTRRSKCVDLKK